MKNLSDGAKRQGELEGRSPSNTVSKRGRARRALNAIGLAITFVLGALAAVVIHLDLPATRRLVATQVSGVLAGTLAGTIEIEHIAGLSLGGLEGVRVRVRDPDGVQVLHADNVQVHIRATEAARSALFDKGPIVLDVPSVWVGAVDVNLDAHPGGDLRIARAFESREPSPPQRPNEPPGRGVRVEAPSVRLGHAWIHGTPPGAPLVDAELSELAGRAHVDPAVVRAEVDRMRLVTRAMPRGADPKGTLGGRFTMPAANGHGVDVQALFEGTVAGIPTTADVRMNDKHVDAKLDMRDATGASTSAVLTEVELRDALSVQAEAHGDLPVVEANAKVALGQATVDATARLEAGVATRIAATVVARHIDASAISEGAPRTDLGLDARGEVTLLEDNVQAEGSVETLPGRIEGELVPIIEAVAKMDNTTSGQIRARIHERTMPTEISVELSPRGDGKAGQLLTASVHSRVPDLRRVPKIGALTGGSAEIDGSGRLTLPEQVFDAKAEVLLRKLSKERLGVGMARVKAHARGTLDRPVIDASLQSRELIAGVLPFASLEARARIEPVGKVVTIRDARIEAVRPLHAPIKVSARLVRLEGPSLRVEGAEVLGVGEPIRAEMSKDARSIRGSVDAPSIDVALVASLAGREQDVKRGTLGIRGEGELRGGEAKGKVHIEARDVEARDVKGAHLTVDGSIDGRALMLEAEADVPRAAKLVLRTQDVVLGGPLNDPSAWKRVKGRVRIESEVDMEKITALVPAARRPLADLRGFLTVQGRFGRDAGDAPPEVQLHAHTTGLVMAGRSSSARPFDSTHVENAPSWRSADVDVALDVRNDGASGFTGVSVRATDPLGIVAAIDLKSVLPYGEIVANPAVARTRIYEAPMSIKVIVPPRPVARLPPVLGVRDIAGAIEAELEVTGTILDPRVHLVARGRGVRSSAMPDEIKADADVTLHYDGKVADLTGTVLSHGQELLLLSSRVEASSRDVILGTSGAPLAWNASGRVRLAAFPLESLPQLADRQIRGRISGEVALEGLHKDAHLAGRIDLDGFTVGQVEYQKGAVTFDAGTGKLAAKVRLDQKEGFLEATVGTGLAWGAALAPTLDAQQPLEAKLLAQAFRAAAIQPFVQSSVPVLDGRIDANARARLVPGKRGAALEGTVSFRDGKVQIAALGEELRGVKAFAAFSPDGTVRITDVTAKGTQGEVHADAHVKIDGMRIEDAVANIRIPDDKPLDLAVEGQPIGGVSGLFKVQVNQSLDGKNTAIVVSVPKLEVELPQVTKTGVQALEEKENVRVGVYRDSGSFLKLPLDKEDTKTQEDKLEEARESGFVDVDVRLGKVTIVRGNQAKVLLTGNPRVRMEGGETKLFGQVRVESGWADVQGKKFEIEKGTVTFNGEVPPNPVVVATAGWTAADGSRVYADFVGPVKTGKVTLRSEPPRPRSEILALVLFGTANGANPTPPPPGKQADGTTKAAAGLGGGFAAQGLTEALDDLAGIQATARVDTTRTNNPRPELEVQLSQRVSVAFMYVIGTPPITEPDKSLVSVEYRFHRNWSVETTVGDRGTTLLDAIWQRRY